MASKDGMLFKFFQNWKQKRLNKFAKNMIKKNPQLEKDLKKLDDIWGGIIKDLEKVD